MVLVSHTAIFESLTRERGELQWKENLSQSGNGRTAKGRLGIASGQNLGKSTLRQTIFAQLRASLFSGPGLDTKG
jgi:hypothetical protein